MKFVISISLSLLALLLSCSSFGAQKALKPASQQEESVMFGRILGAVEDEGGGYLREAKARFVWINNELRRRQYSPRLQWMAHLEYGKTLLASKETKQAIRYLELAKSDAESLTSKEQEQTADVLREARAKVE